MAREKYLTFLIIAGIASSITAACGQALADDFVRLVEPAGKNIAIAPSSPLIFDLGDDVTAERMGNLFLEFDGEDVTPAVQLNGRRVTYQPASRLSVGDHVVKLYEHVGNEKYTVLKRFVVRVSGEKSEDKHIWGEAAGQYNALLTDRVLNGRNHPDTNSASAFLNSNAVAGGKSWDISARFNGNYDSIPANNYDDRAWQLGEYLLTGRGFAEHGNVMARLGNHDIGVSNLLIDRFNRRGASLQLEALNRFRLIGFAQDPAKAIGSVNVSGIGKSEERVGGTQLQFYPLGLDENFWLEGGYINGEGRERGRGDALIDNISKSGQGWNLGSQWQGFKDRARLRGEFARTTHDYDGNGTLIEPLSDNALHGLAGVALIGDLNPATYDQTSWNLTLDAKRVGTYFHSLANNNFPGDQKRASLVSDFVDESLTVVADFYVLKNNVNQLADIPTDKTQGSSVQTSITPAYFGLDLPDNSWFANSVFTAGAYLHNTFRDKTPAGFVGDNLRYHNSGGNVGWSANFTEYTISLTHNYTEYRDKILRSDNQDSHLTELAISYFPEENFVISPSLQHERLRYVSADEQSNYFAGLDVNYTIIKDTLTNHSYAAMQLNDSGSDDKQYNASSEFFWTIAKAQRNAPGYGIGLNGQYQNVADRAALRSDIGSQYKIYLTLKINAPFGW